MSRRPSYRGPQDICGVCESYVPRRRLVMTQVMYQQPQGENLFTHSSYNSAGWTADEDPIGDISLGASATYCLSTPNTDASWPSSKYNTVTVAGGSQTWEDSPVSIVSTAIDISAYSNVCFRFSAGLHQSAIAETLTIAAGYTASGEAKQQQASWEIKSSRDLWFTLDVSSIVSPYSSGALQFYVTGTCDGKWWIDSLQVCSGTKPGNFLKTSGAARINTAESAAMTVKKVCPKCRERLLKTSDAYKNVGAEEPPPIVDVDIQEV